MSLTLVNSLDPPGVAPDVRAGISAVFGVGQLAYVASFAELTIPFEFKEEFTLQILDVSDPSNPSVVGTLTLNNDSNDRPTDIFVSGSYAYVTFGAGSGLQIIDVSNPSTPSLVGSYPIEGELESVAVAGGNAYLADQLVFDESNSGAIHIVDISNPGQPTFVADFFTPTQLGASATAPQSITVSGNYLYIADYAPAIYIVDISNPAHPSLVGTYTNFPPNHIPDLSGPGIPNSPQSVFVSNNLLYVADDVSGLYILDVSNPASPSLVGTYFVPGLSRFDAIEVAGNFAYVDWHLHGVQEFDVTDPAHPTLIAAIATPSVRSELFLGMDVANGYVYVPLGQSGLEIIRIGSENQLTDDYRDSLDDATAPLGVFAVGGSATGTIRPELGDTDGDKDVFKISLAGENTYTLSVSGAAVGGFDPLSQAVFTIRDGTDFNTVLATSSRGPIASLNFMVEKTADFYIRVGASGDNFESAVGGYLLQGTAGAPINSLNVTSLDNVDSNSVSAQEIVNIARANNGALWGALDCTDLVWAVTNLAGARFFDMADRTIADDPLRPDLGGYLVPHNDAWVAAHDPLHHPGEDNTSDQWEPVLIPTTLGLSFEAALRQVLLPGDVVRTYLDSAQGTFDGHSFIVVGKTLNGNSPPEIQIIDNVDGDAHNPLTNTILVHELTAFPDFMRPHLDDPANVYVFRLKGNWALEGSTGDDLLVGGQGNDLLTGGGGNDTLYAGAGNDTVEGGAGNDFIIAGSGEGDDLYDGGGGTDTIAFSSTRHGVTVSLSTLWSKASGDEIGTDQLKNIENIIGGTGHDILVGNARDNTIEGGAGSDLLIGLSGRDTASYESSHAGVFINLSPSGAQSGGDAQGDRLNGFENITGSSFNDTLKGTHAANVLKGLFGDDVLDGRAGNDLLVGGFGNDRLNGGSGRDWFKFDAPLDESNNVDRISDFSSAYDTILLDHTIFAEIDFGPLKKSAFHIGTGAHDENDRIIYNRRTGDLLYDADGNGSAEAILFARMSTGLSPTHNDFVVT